METIESISAEAREQLVDEFIHVVPFRDEQERLVRELQAAYLTMSEDERQAEVALAEEGLYGQLSPSEAFPGEDEWPWWE